MRGVQRSSPPLLLSVSFLFQREKKTRPGVRQVRQVPREKANPFGSGEVQEQMKVSIPGLMKEKFLNMFWSMLLISALSANDSRGFSLRNSLSKLLQSKGDFWATV